MKVSVIIPTKNEPLINELIGEIRKSLKNPEIIVVDKSKKKPKIKKAKLVIQKSTGLGKAVIEGLKHAKGDIIVIMDGDFSHNPKDIKKLLDRINNFDIVIGSRYVEDGETKDKIHRRFISYVFRKISNTILDLDVQDPMSGFSAIKRKVFDNLKIDPIGYKINMEIIYKAKKKGYKVCEVPIKFKPRKKGKSKASFKEPFRILRYIFELRFGLR
jgi:dolichol-phosphate mannosyltransferase